MKKIQVLLDFIKYSVAEKIPFYRNVIARIKANSITFVTPDKDLASVEGLVNDLDAKLIETENGGHTATVALHTAEGITDDAFRVLAAYVNRIANGDENVILSSGFNTTPQPTSINKRELTVEDGEISGTVKLIAKAVNGASSYIWQYAKDILPTDETGWITSGYSTRASTEIDELTVGAKYYFRMAAITTNGVTGFTSAISLIIR